jgi:hypothetical protein
MTRASSFEIVLACLADDFKGYDKISKEAAYEVLKIRTGQDFGFEVKAWEQWLDANVANWRFETRLGQMMNNFEVMRENISTLFWLTKDVLRRAIGRK